MDKLKFKVYYKDKEMLPDIIEANKLWNDETAYSFLNVGTSKAKWDTICSIPVSNIHKVEQLCI